MVITNPLLTQIRSDIKTDLANVLLVGSIGTSSTTPTSGDTALGASVFVDTLDSFDTSAADAITSSLRVTSTEANGNAIAEHGLSDDLSGTTLWTRNTLTAINKTSDIELFFDTTITITVVEE